MASSESKSIECPICFEIPSPPIYQCCNGHIVCSVCLPKIANCGICRETMPSKPIRCLIAEQFAETIAKFERSDTKSESCQNYCGLLGLSEILDCHEKITQDDIVSHMEDHLLNGVKGRCADICQELEDLVNPQTWFPVYFEAFEKIFFLLSGTENISPSNSDKQIFWKCVVSGNSDTAKDFCVHFTLTNRKNDLKSIFMAPVASVEDMTASEKHRFTQTIQFVREFMGIRTNSKKMDWTIRSQIVRKSTSGNKYYEIKESENVKVPKVKTSSFLAKNITYQAHSSTPVPRSIIENSTPGRPKVFLDLAYDKKSIGRLVIELRNDIVPITTENFRALCTGENGFGYKGSAFYHVLPNSHMIGGDITKNDGNGGKSIYGETFEDENFILKHSERGIVSMVKNGKANNSNFLITYKEMSECDGLYVVFGKVVQGMEHIIKLENLINALKGQKNKKTTITNCGQL